MKEVRYEQMIRLSMRSGLTPDEEVQLEAFLAAHPEARADWEEERALSRAVQSLPDVPVSSNFTARVLQVVDLEERQEQRRSRSRPWLRVLLPRLSWLALAALLASFGAHQYREGKRVEMVKDLPWVPTDLASLSSPDVLQDFDAISQLQQVAATSDEELLKALQ